MWKYIKDYENYMISDEGDVSQFKSVCWHVKAKKWCANIWLDNKKVWIGSYNTELEAHNAYKNKLNEYENSK